MKSRIFGFALLSAIVAGAPAQAQSARTFVSLSGSDNNPCSVTQPCRHFQAAVNVTAVGGEVDALDPGAYGSFTIGQAITIEGQGWSYIIPGANSAGITVNAGSNDSVTIRGVSINGEGLTNDNGIQFNTGGSLTIQNSAIRNNTNSGIFFAPSASSRLVVSNTTVSDSGQCGIFIQPTGSSSIVAANLNRVEVTGGGGIQVTAASTTGGTLTVAVANSSVSGNAVGISVFADAGQAVTKVTLFQSIVTNNSGGVQASAPNSTVTLGQSSVTGNVTYGYDLTKNTVMETYQDNYLDDNGPSNGVPNIISKQ